MTWESERTVRHTNVTAKRWPCIPYKGFSYYGPNDIPIFAGRDNEIVEFAEFVGDSETRLVLLQGATGCGKSSFLRAGVIPFLEGSRRGFEFRKFEEDGQPSKAIFIRSTDLPLQRLAEEIFKLARDGYSFESPLGEEVVDLSGVLRGHQSAEEFAAAAMNDPEVFVAALRAISGEIPATLVLIIDQGEEALSLDGSAAVPSQSPYYRFLSLFAASDFPLKLIISLRTDYFGLFFDAIWGPSTANYKYKLEHFLLRNLDLAGLVDAIVRPTLGEPQGGYPPPPYEFQFEEGLPKLIATDLVRKARVGGLPGGELPVLQVVCETLYMKLKSRQKPWVITHDDYAALGEIDIQLNDYVDRVLVRFCKQNGLPQKQMTVEICRWKDALSSLVRIQASNALTTDIKTLHDLIKTADRSTIYFPELPNYLSQDDVGVLRAEQVKRIQSSGSVRTFSLRHDAVGLVLNRWKEAREARQTTVSVYPVLSGSTGLIYFLTGLAAFVVGLFSEVRDQSLEALFGIIAGAVLVAVGVAFLRWSTRDNLSVTSQILAFEIFLWLARIPLLRHLLRGDDKDRLSSLQQNPIFRLLIQTNSGAEVRFQMLVNSLDRST